MGKSVILFTCEHGGNQIPRAYRKYFENSERFLNSHRGWDPGALKVAKQTSTKLQAPLLYSEVSRLLVDLNRTADEPTAFSNLVPEVARKTILSKYYWPYRDSVTQALKKNNSTLHFSIHSFTPVRRGIKRECEIGLLFDPSRPREKATANALKTKLQILLPKARIRMNYPYKGTDDGFTTTLRKALSDRKYAGIEIEMNQGWIKNPRTLEKVSTALTEAIGSLQK